MNIPCFCIYRYIQLCIGSFSYAHCLKIEGSLYFEERIALPILSYSGFCYSIIFSSSGVWLPVGHNFVQGQHQIYLKRKPKQQIYLNEGFTDGHMWSFITFKLPKRSIEKTFQLSHCTLLAKNNIWITIRSSPSAQHLREHRHRAGALRSILQAARCTTCQTQSLHRWLVPLCVPKPLS